MKILKKVLLVVVIILISLPLLLNVMLYVLFKYGERPIYDEKMVKDFEEYRQDFDVINNYMMENYGYMQYTEHIDDILVLCEEDGKYKNVYGAWGNEDIEMPEEVKQACDSVAELFAKYKHNKLDTVCFDRNRISYGGDGKIMFVYSKFGESPNYYYKNSDISFTCYKLTDNWYCLKAHLR